MIIETESRMDNVIRLDAAGHAHSVYVGEEQGDGGADVEVPSFICRSFPSYVFSQSDSSLLVPALVYPICALVSRIPIGI